MPVHSVKNQYRGINPHLHSKWQSNGGWNNFHNPHIATLSALFRQRLLPMGYTATIDESLQVRRIGDKPRRPRADILVTDLQPYREFKPTPSAAPMLTVADLVEDIDEEKPYRAIAIYEQSDAQGEPIAWIELLSPSSKGDGHDAQTYRVKRHLLLENHLVFIELDYLHETPPTFTTLPDYTQNERGSHPYRIVLLDPRPDFRTGPAIPAEFDVDALIPTLNIPLNEGDSLRFDFGAAYSKTYEEMVYGLEYVDYAELPTNYERYSIDDQTQIARRMLAVLQAAQTGADLESAPFPVNEMLLNEALAQIDRLRSSLK